ncbi:MAG: HAD-IA family hydrolase [Alphaproteobacteria bacterium]|nr:HAD-IA family hydrolase [Alphaproteobacteria bacterium]
MSSLSLVVFDCDGTLVDSQHHIVDTMKQAFRSEGLAAPDGDAVRHVIGLPLWEAIHKVSDLDETEDEGLLDRLDATYREIFRERRTLPDHDEPLFDGIREVVEGLNGAGYLLGVATGKGRRGLDAVLDRHGLAHHFVTLKTADDGPGKPNPDMLEAAMREAGVVADRTVMIGDTSYDIEMALNAGVRSIGVSWGYHDPEYLNLTGANRIVQAVSDIPASVRDLLSAQG